MKYWVSLTEVSNYCKVQGKLVFDPLLLAAVLMFNEKSKLLKLLFLHFSYLNIGEKGMHLKWQTNDFPRVFFLQSDMTAGDF